MLFFVFFFFGGAGGMNIAEKEGTCKGQEIVKSMQFAAI